MPIEPFRIAIPQEDLDDLHRRVARRRRARSTPDPDWNLGTDPAALEALLDHWIHRFDWRGVEQRLNAWPQFLADVDGTRIHLVRTGTAGAPPLLLLHGWPGSFVQMERLWPRLTGFDVITASLPGFGVHLSGTTPRAADPMPADATAAELRFADDVAAWRATEVGYGAIQSTKPQTLAVALADSPAGTAAWIVEKYRRWSDCGGEVTRRFSADDLLTVASLYWLTGSIATSIRLYAESGDDPDLRRVPVPVAHLMSDRDMLHTPREWVARGSRIDRWTQVDRGGHFLEFEEPDLVADDLHAFFLSDPAR